MHSDIECKIATAWLQIQTGGCLGRSQQTRWILRDMKDGVPIPHKRTEPLSVGPDVHICLLLLPNFSLLSVSSAIDPIRMANKILGYRKYRLSILSLDGNPVRSSGGQVFPIDGCLADLDRADLLLVCSSDDVEQVDLPASLAPKLRSMASRGCDLGALCTGAFVLARLGLLEDHSCTIHWEYASMFRESFPFIALKQDVFVIDRRRLTCAGGTAALDLMLVYLGRSCPSDIVSAVADMAIHHDQRWSDTDQRIAIGRRLGISQPKILHAISLMEQNIETPLSCSELAEEIGLGVRQFQRLFQATLGVSPIGYYIDLRLAAARDLVLKTSMPITKISFASGFVGPANFTKRYRDRFGVSPQEDRKPNRSTAPPSRIARRSGAC